MKYVYYLYKSYYVTKFVSFGNNGNFKSLRLGLGLGIGLELGLGLGLGLGFVLKNFVTKFGNKKTNLGNK